MILFCLMDLSPQVLLNSDGVNDAGTTHTAHYV